MYLEIKGWLPFAIDNRCQRQYYLTKIMKLVKWSKLMQKSTNSERERRILDAASELFTHFGFDKTTVSDVARDAGISKGAIYLHFKSKDEMLEALIMREMRVYAEEWLALLAADPAGGTIGGMYKNSLYALNKSPFMSAMFRRDSRVLGNYLRKPNNLFQMMREQQTESDRLIFVRMMQAAGVIRDDIDAIVIAHVMDILAHGLVGMEEIVPADSIPPIDALIEGIAVIMDDALTPASADPEVGKGIVKQISDATRGRLGLDEAS